jgi:hypothetical protein
MTQRDSHIRRSGPRVRAGTVCLSALALLFSALAISGCANQQPVRILDDVFGQYVPLTLPIFIVGDTQEHESTGFPLHQNDGAVDAYVEVAQRPPEQPLFGRRLLEWAIESHPDTPMIHLGDVIDMSCLSEHRRMQKIFEKGKQPVIVSAGNHDGLLFGIFNHDIVSAYAKGEDLEWFRGCRPGTGLEEMKHPDGRGPGLNKRNFIAGYLRRLSTRQISYAGLSPPAETGNVTVSWVNPDPQGFIERIEAYLVDGPEYAQSFILQKIRLPPAPGAPLRTTIVTLDTSQLNTAIGFFNMAAGLSPGDTGLVLEKQAKIFEQVVGKARKAGEVVIFAGHHPWDMLSPGTRARLKPILRSVDHPIVYLSAHTHQGFWAVHRIDGRAMLELNVSSLSDWPLAYRLVSFAYDGQAKHIRVIADLMPSAGKPPMSDDELLEAWTEPACGQAGFSVEELSRKDTAVIREQKASRGSLIDWLLTGLADLNVAPPKHDDTSGPYDSHNKALQKLIEDANLDASSYEALQSVVESKSQSEAYKKILQNHYENAHPYQNGLLEVIIEFYDDLGGKVEELSRIRPPAFCGNEGVRDCAASLRSSKWDSLSSAVELYRKKAAFVDHVERQLDDIDDPRAKGYMTCRAAIAAKLDHDLTPEDKQPGTPESERRRLNFFRSAATVGME